MIKLTKNTKPPYLTDDKVQELTDKYKSDGSAVWNHDKIKIPLLESSSNKCAYCECSLGVESKYMEVEHFEDKHRNPNKVVDWSNLLPSCKRCNGSKGTHDVISEPIINPFVVDPRQHISLWGFRFKAKTQKGQDTIDIIDLNNSEKLVKARFAIGETLAELIVRANDNLKIYLSDKSIRNRNKVVSVVQGILSECQSNSDYSASTATRVIKDADFVHVIEVIKDENIWTEELENLFLSAQNQVLDVTFL